MRSVGVEEELLLIDPDIRKAVPRAHEVVKHNEEHDRPSAEGSRIERELFRHQLEVQTDPVTDLNDLASQVVARRRVAAQAAGELGLAVVASGTSPLALVHEVSNEDRYRAMVQGYGEIARGGGTCGLHVHVGVDSDEEGVRVIDSLGPWLPVVLAISANSPYTSGRDTGHASWRTLSWGQWPTAGPTQAFGSVATYRAVSANLLATGAARDERMLYFDARLGIETPTVEIRVADVTTDPLDTVLVAAVVRALVDTASRDGALRARGDLVGRLEPVRAARWHAARHGLAHRLVHPATGELAPAKEVLVALTRHLGDSLSASADTDLVAEGLERVMHSQGATRQRAAFERTGSMAGVVDDLITRTADRG